MAPAFANLFVGMLEKKNMYLIHQYNNATVQPVSLALPPIHCQNFHGLERIISLFDAFCKLLEFSQS